MTTKNTSNIVVFSPETCEDRKHKEVPKISFDRKRGGIHINKAAADIVGIKDGDAVVFCGVEKDRHKGIYIMKVDDSILGFKVKAKRSAFTFFNVCLCRKVSKYLLDDDSETGSLRAKIAKVSESVEISGRPNCYALIDYK